MTAEIKAEVEKLKQDLFLREAELAKAHEAQKTLNDRPEHAMAEYERLSEVVEFIRSVDIKSAKPLVIEPRLADKTSESTAMLIGSDWHLMERVDPATVNGINEYNPSIAEKSVMTFFRDGMRWTEIHRAGTKIKTVVLALLGDLIAGAIHDDIAETNFAPPGEQLICAFRLIKGGIDFILKDQGVEEVVVVCCDGNHGRMTEKMRVNARRGNSLEWILYKFVESVYENDKRVKFLIADGIHVYLDLYGSVIRFHHGDAIRYSGGVGGITIPASKKIAKWNDECRADLDIFGHYHELFKGGNFLVNGSTVGYNSYAKKIGASFQKPQQAFVMWNKRYGFVGYHPIYVR